MPEHHSIDALLAMVSRGTGFFRAQLDGLPDDALDGDSLLPGWTRRHVVVHTGYNALAIARLAEWARTGIESPMYASPDARNAEIQEGVTLEPPAIRRLFIESAAGLEDAWGRLAEADWERPVRTAQGRVIPASESAWLRAREVWIHAVDLNTGAGFDDLPDDVLERLLGDVTEAWAARGDGVGLRLEIVNAGAQDPDNAANGTPAGATTTVVRGTLADLTAWACGRDANGITSSAGEVPTAPPWI